MTTGARRTDSRAEGMAATTLAKPQRTRTQPLGPQCCSQGRRPSCGHVWRPELVLQSCQDTVTAQRLLECGQVTCKDHSEAKTLPPPKPEMEACRAPRPPDPGLQVRTYSGIPVLPSFSFHGQGKSQVTEEVSLLSAATSSPANLALWVLCLEPSKRTLLPATH